MRTRTLILLSSLWLTLATAWAEPEQLSGKVMSERLPGATIEIDTPIGTKIPMRFGGDGLVTGEAGVLGAYLGAAKDRGRWWVASDRLCIKWFRWFDSQPRCMDIKVDGTKVFWQKEDGESGTATLSGAPPKVAEKKQGAASPADPTPAVKVQPKPALTAKSTSPAQPAAEPVAHEDAPPPKSIAAEAAGTPISDLPVQPAPVAEVVPEAAQPVPQQQPAASAAVPAPALPPSALGAPPSQMAQDMAMRMASPPSPESQPSPSVTGVAPRPARPVTAQQVRQANAVARTKPTSSANAPPSKPAKAAAKRVSKDAPGSFRVARVESDDMLNVRSGPSEEHKAIGVISSKGRGVKITGPCQGEWCPIRHGGLTGWVNRYYLTEESGSRP